MPHIVAEHGRPDGDAHDVGRAGASTASCSSPSAACRARTRRSMPAARWCTTLKDGLYAHARARACASSTSRRPPRISTPAATIEWLAIRPNTDAALMLALCHVLLTEKLHDREFLDRCTRRLRQVRALRSPTRRRNGPKEITRHSGVAASAALAREMAATRTTVNINWSLQRCASRRAAVLGAGDAGLHAGPDRPAGRRLRRELRPGQRRWAASAPLFSGPTLSAGHQRGDDFIPVARITDMLLNPGGKLRLQRPGASPIPTSGWSTGRAAIRSTITRTSTACARRGASPRRSSSTSSSGRRPRKHGRHRAAGDDHARARRHRLRAAATAT